MYNRRKGDDFDEFISKIFIFIFIFINLIGKPNNRTKINNIEINVLAVNKVINRTNRYVKSDKIRFVCFIR